LDMEPFDRTHVTFYRRSIVSMALSRVISEMFNVKKIEIRVTGHSRSLKVVPFDRLGTISY